MFASLGLLAGCSSSSGGESAGTETSTFESTYLEPELSILAPLSGVEVDQAITNPALSVKIPNVDYPGGARNAARPQWGINQADIVYEELVEGGLTRYVAQFQSNIPDIVGPVRSIRPMDPAIISPVGGIVAYSGGQKKFRNMMKDTGIPNITEGNSNYERSSERNAPNNLILHAKDLVADYSDVEAPDQQFSYAADVEHSTPVLEGKSVSDVVTNFSTSSTRSWKYNEEKQVWARLQYGEKDVDHDGKRITATNLVVLKVDIDRTKYASMHSSPPYTVFKGTGEAWFSVGGKYVKGTWSKTRASERVVFTDEQGFPVQLAPGNTWIELVPNDTGEFSYK